jgi:Ca2+/Na+ antiporter
MAVSACFGAPMLNNVLGLGLALTVVTLQRFPAQFEIGVVNRSLHIARGFLIVSLVTSAMVFHFSGLTLPRWHAYFLFSLYGAFVVTAIMFGSSV